MLSSPPAGKDSTQKQLSAASVGLFSMQTHTQFCKGLDFQRGFKVLENVQSCTFLTTEMLSHFIHPELYKEGSVPIEEHR